MLDCPKLAALESPRWPITRHGILGMGFVLGLVFSAAVQAQAFYETTATGVAAGSKNTARPEAILNAQRDIVLSYLEAQVPREALPALRPLLDKPGVYVAKYTVGREDYADGVLTLKLRARVSESQLRRDMGALLRSQLPDDVRAALIVGVDDPEFGVLAVPVEDAIAKAFESSPVATVGVEESRRFFLGEMDVAAESDRMLAGTIARGVFADVAIGLWIETSVKPQVKDTNVSICHAKLRAQLIDARSGTLIREMGDEAKVQSADPTEGLTQAVEDILVTFTRQVEEEALLACVRAAPAKAIELEVAGIGSEENWAAVCNRLEGTFGTDAMEHMLYHPESGRLRIYGEPSVGAVVRLLTKREFDDFYLEVERAVGRSLVLVVEPK